MGKIIDFHSHILPKMDDGSDSVSTSCRMLDELRAQGVDIVCATSHYYSDENSIPVFLERRSDAFTALSEAYETSNIILGAEVEFFPGMSDCDELDSLCLGDTATLLLEMPFSIWTAKQISEVVSLMVDRDLDVVLAHPERFMFYSGNEAALKRLAEYGVGLQVNAETFLHWRTRKAALSLLKMSDSPYIGSDSHNMTNRSPKIGEARKTIASKAGSRFLAELDYNMNETLGFE